MRRRCGREIATPKSGLSLQKRLSTDILACLVMDAETDDSLHGLVATKNQAVSALYQQGLSCSRVCFAIDGHDDLGARDLLARTRTSRLYIRRGG